VKTGNSVLKVQSISQLFENTKYCKIISQKKIKNRLRKKKYQNQGLIWNTADTYIYEQIKTMADQKTVKFVIFQKNARWI